MTGHRSPESAYVDIFALSSKELTSCFVKSILIIYIYIYIYNEIVILKPACSACMIWLQVKMGLFSSHQLVTGDIYENL